MTNKDHPVKARPVRLKSWKSAEQTPTDSKAANPQETRAKRKARMKRDVQRLRQRNELDLAKKRADRRNAKAALARISSPEKRRAFIAARKAQARAALQAAREDARLRRQEIAALPPAKRKEAKWERKYQRRLVFRASRAYRPVAALGAVALAALAAGCIYIGYIVYGVFFDNSYAFNNTDMPIIHPSGSDTDPETSSSSYVDPYSLLLSEADLEFMKNRANILIMGVDNNDERDDPGSYDRTDTMLLLSVDFETNNAYIISLPRDSYVWIYNKNYRSRLNTAFGAGGGLDGDGFEYAMNTVSMLLGGIPINNYICFDMDVVMDVVNAMDGIDYYVDISFWLDGRCLNEGFQHMNGQQVLDYCRVRENVTGGTDIARTARQRKMIMAIFSYMKDNGQLKDIPAIYSAVAKNIYTDLTFEQITSLAAFSLKLDTECIHDYLLPGKYLNEFEGASFWGIDQSEKKDMIYEIFGQTIKIDSRDDVDTLRALAEKKSEAIADGQAAISDTDAYIASNSLYVSADLHSQYSALKNELETAMDERNPHNIESTIEPIITVTQALNDWVENTLKPAVQAAIAKLPTPTPEPSGTPEPSESSPDESP